MLLFFISIKLKVFRVTQNDTPKMVKKFAYTNNLSRFFVEHVKYVPCTPVSYQY